MMPRFELKAEYLSVDIFEIEAEDADHAMQLFMGSGGEYGDGHNCDYALNRIVSVKEVNDQ